MMDSIDSYLEEQWEEEYYESRKKKHEMEKAYDEYVEMEFEELRERDG